MMTTAKTTDERLSDLASNLAHSERAVAKVESRLEDLRAMIMAAKKSHLFGKADNLTLIEQQKLLQRAIRRRRKSIALLLTLIEQEGLLERD